MEDLLLSKESEAKLVDYIKAPNQSVVLIGSQWLDKNKTAQFISAKMLEITEDKLSNYPHFHQMSSADNKKIGIEEIRKLNTVLSLVVPSKKSISRVIVISDAHLMTQEAQNALLKNLEEPPEGTRFILTTTTINSLLPTITSRVSTISLSSKSRADILSWYKNTGYQDKDIETAYSMSGGQPMLMELLLKTEDHPLSKATLLAKEMLQGTKLDRLALINELAKDKANLDYFFFIIKEMAKIGVKSENQASAKRWHKILLATLKAETMLSASGQIKLTLTDFVLNIS